MSEDSIDATIKRVEVHTRDNKERLFTTTKINSKLNGMISGKIGNMAARYGMRNYNIIPTDEKSRE